MIWIVIVFFMFILFWEGLALLDKQREIPTWSRLIRAIGSGHPEWKPAIVVITLTIGFTFTIWAAIHFITPEGWLWDQILFLFEDFCVTIGIPC
jgi:hypothetical protein